MTSKLAAPPLVVTSEQREVLRRLARSSSLPHRTVLQAKALLLSANGDAIYEVARRLEVASNSIRQWRRRFEQEGLEGIGVIAPGRGRTSWLPEGTVAEVVRLTMNELPHDGSTQWSTRTMAERVGVSKDTVARIWKDHGLKPWKVDAFKVSTDPHFEEKLVDVVGLYLNPPERAVVFSFDEKTQIQALDRTQPSLPMKKGRGSTMTHDYKRNGTTDLFAAMNVATGEVLHDTKSRHSSKEVLVFFKSIDAHVDRSLEIHVVLDNLSAHKSKLITTWLAHPRRARWHLHFTPTSSSWLNLVESWFAQLTNRQLKKGTFSSVTQLQEEINRWAKHWNENPTPFVWKKTADEIIAKVSRGRSALASIKSATDH
jgi:transposase